MKIHHLIPILFLTGCASSSKIVDRGADALPQKPEPILDESQRASVRLPERLKAYPVGRYEDPADPEIMHEGHTVYRAETSPAWNTAPNEPTSLPLGPGEMAVADPAQEHTALTAELEQRLKQEDQLLQTTYNRIHGSRMKLRRSRRSSRPSGLPTPESNPPHHLPWRHPNRRRRLLLPLKLHR